MRDIPSTPFKGLNAFADSPLDALLFFGRGSERETIVANVLASKLTVLYGASGVGKSSLLRAGVAQELRQADHGVVVVHDSWVDEPVSGLVGAIRDACPDVGPTAGLADTVAAVAQNEGEVFLLLDQFEEYFLYHGADGPLSSELPEALGRPGLRISVLIALRDDALSELDAFTDRVPGVFANMLRLDRLDRRAARAAVVGPLERYGEITGDEYGAEPELIDAVLDEVAEGRVDFSGASDVPGSSGRIEAPFLQLVLERLWEEEQAAGSHVLRLDTFLRLGGAEPIVREHVHGTLDRLAEPERTGAARVVRQLVTPSGSKIAHTAADLAEYSEIEPEELQTLLRTLTRDRIVRGVDGVTGRATRYEIFHDILAAPVLAWRVGFDIERERIASRRQRRRLRTIAVASLVALAVVAAIAVYAFLQRSDARTQARRAHGRELAADALAAIPSNPATSVALALRAAGLAPGAQTEDVLRSSLLALRERRVLPVGGNVAVATFAPRNGRLLVATSAGSADVFAPDGKRLIHLHGGAAVTHAAWSPDGRTLVTGDADGTVTVVRAADGAVLRRIPTPAPVSALVFGGSTLLVAGGGHLRILSAIDARVRTIRVPGAVIAAAISPDARFVAFAAERKSEVATKILDLRTGHVSATLRERGIESLVFSANGRLLVTGSSDGTARVWSVPTGRRMHLLPMKGKVLSERFSKDGRWLVTASADGTAAVWNVRSGARELLLTGANGAAEDASFSPDGKEIAVAFSDRLARIYSSQDGRLLAPLAGHRDALTTVAFDPSGSIIATGSVDGTVRLWDANPSGSLTTIDRRNTSVDALFTGTRVVSVGGTVARVLDPTGHPIAQLEMPAPIVVAAASNSSVALADKRGDLELATLGGPTRRVDGLGISALAFTPDGTLLTGSRDGTVRIWTAAKVRLVRSGAPVAEIAAARDRFAVRSRSGSVRIYSIAGRSIARIEGRALHVALDAEGDRVATTRAREADIWDATTGALLHRLRGHRSLVTDAEFSPDGTMLVTASDDHDGRIWSVATGRPLHILRGHFFPVRSASFSPNGRWIVTASQFSGGLWDAASGQLVLYLQGHTKPLTSATFDQLGEWIVTGADDGTTSVYRCEVCSNLAGLEQVAARRMRSIR